MLKENMKRLFAAVIMLLAGNAYALDWHDSPEVGKLLSNVGVQGTFVLYDLAETATAERLKRAVTERHGTDTILFKK
jgi:hypothetical protein